KREYGVNDNVLMFNASTDDHLELVTAARPHRMIETCEVGMRYFTEPSIRCGVGVVGHWTAHYDVPDFHLIELLKLSPHPGGSEGFTLGPPSKKILTCIQAAKLQQQQCF